jgi:hypothetical protein
MCRCKSSIVTGVHAGTAIGLPRVSSATKTIGQYAV